MQRTLDNYYKLFEGKDPLEVNAFLTLHGEKAIRIEYDNIDEILDLDDLAKHKFYHYTINGEKRVYKNGELIDQYPHNRNEIYIRTTLSKKRLIDKLDLRKNVFGVDYVIDHQGYALYEEPEILAYINSQSPAAELYSRFCNIKYRAFKTDVSLGITLRCFNMFQDKADQKVSATGNLTYDVETGELTFNTQVINRMISYDTRLTPKQRKYLMSMGKVIVIRRDHFKHIGLFEQAGYIERIEDIKTDLDYGNHKEIKFLDSRGSIITKFEDITKYKGVIISPSNMYMNHGRRAAEKLGLPVHQDSLQNLLNAGALMVSPDDFENHLKELKVDEKTSIDKLPGYLINYNYRESTNMISKIRYEIKTVYERVQLNSTVSA